MILSRVWYVLLGLAVAVAMYIVYLAVGQYERQATRALKEGLASDSQTVEWALKIDTRRRLDALLAGSVDSALQQALVAANASKDGKVPAAAQTAAKKALRGQRRHRGGLPRRRALRREPGRSGRGLDGLRQRERGLRAGRIPGRERRAPRL